MNKKNLSIICTGLMFYYGFSVPKMTTVSSKTYQYKNETYKISEIMVSEHKITVGEWEEYLKATNKKKLHDFEHELKRIIDSYQEPIDCSWPVFGITWLEAVEFCNWISEREHLQPCYTFTKNKNNTISVNTNYSVNGYRLPTVSEWFYFSELWHDKADDYYKTTNILNKKIDLNRQIPFSIEMEERNSIGLYDVIGNIPEMCNNYFDEEIFIENYLSKPYGPSTYTPDPDQIYFNEPVTEVRCLLGGSFSSDFSLIKNNLLNPINMISSQFAGFRIVRKNKCIEYTNFFYTPTNSNLWEQAFL